MKPSFFKSVSFALNGVKLALLEKHIKIHLMITVLCIALGFFLHINNTDWCIILICIASVLALEMINTSIEQLVNLVEPNYHPKAGAIKDLAAGAVLIAVIIAVVIGGIVFGKYILALRYNF